MVTELTRTADTPLDSAAALNIITTVLRDIGDFNGDLAPDVRIDRFLVETFGDVSLEYLDFQLKLESLFGIRITDDDWNFLTGWSHCKSADEWEMRFANMFTFGRLAEFIAASANMMRVQPMTILGSTCHAAGAFRAMERIAGNLNPEIERFAPSTPIADRLRFSELRQFWARVQALCPERIPPLTSPRIQDIADDLLNRRVAPLSLFVSLCIVFAIGLANRLPALLGWPGFIAALLLMSLGLSAVPAALLWVACNVAPGLARWIQNGRGALPKDIETFGDLARLLAGERGGWCDSCGYDLTGVESGRCPECGRETTPPLAMPFPARATIQKTG